MICDRAIYFCGSKVTTAGNITLEHADGTDIAVVAKGTSTGVLTAEESLAATTVVAGDALQIKSSSAGNAVCFVTYTFDA